MDLLLEYAGVRFPSLSSFAVPLLSETVYQTLGSSTFLFLLGSTQG